ncbi:MAG: hypothetical protein FWG31_00720 [Oscillospiraceae bacterium]|nr:hypothetical protein [Oscillospiraceae bacterium]
MRARFKTAPPSVLLAAIFLFFSLLYFTLRLFGYTLVPNSRVGPTALSTVITGAMVWLTVKGVKTRKDASKLTVVTSALLPPLAVIFCIGKDIGYDVGGIEVYTLTVYAYISMTCAMALFFTNVKSLMFRYIAGIIYCVLIVIFSFGLFVQMVLWDWDSDVVWSELSPNGVYLAEVYNNGNIWIKQQGKDKNILIGTLKKDTKEIYEGNPNGADKLIIRWEEDDILYINSNIYTIK